jgi:nicotinamidase-related amidase
MNPVLLVIDVQKGIDDSVHWGGSRNNPQAEGNIKLLLSLWRLLNFPVVFVKHDSRESTSPLNPRVEGNEFKEFVQPFLNGHIITKSTANAFINTSLRETLNTLGVTDIVITGFVTNNSIEATTRMSGELGYATVVVSDATACFNKKGLDGTIFSAELVHQVSLANLQHEYARIVTTQEIIDQYKDETLAKG